MLFMGIDVGTQGVRCVAADGEGRIVAARSVPFETLNIAGTPGWLEQSPRVWQDAAEAAVRGCMADLKAQDIAPDAVAAISVDGTSGTVVPLDAAHVPLTNGIMYNDPRAGAEAAEVHAALAGQEARLGYRFGASFSLPRVLWVMRHRPDVYGKTAVFAHQADYIAGLLCGEYAVSDDSNALKTGYDLLNDRWPAEVASKLGIDPGRLPRIVRPGAPIAPVTAAAARKLGLSERTMVVGGSTDGYASALAAGAVRPGSWASIIGTTFVLKGATQKLVLDPGGASYSHRLPSGAWLLGGASNLGGRTLNACAGERGFDELNAAMEESEAALNDKKIALEESGSIAEAALRLSGVFTAAQDAADRYTEEMRERADALVAEAQRNAEEILSQARAEAQKLLSEARREAAPAPQSAPQPPEPSAPPQDEGKRRGGLFRRKS